jgi:hypothetical protein
VLSGVLSKWGVLSNRVCYPKWGVLSGVLSKMRCVIQNEVCYPKWVVLSKMRCAIQNEVCSPKGGVLCMCYPEWRNPNEVCFCMCYPEWRNPRWCALHVLSGMVESIPVGRMQPRESLMVGCSLENPLVGCSPENQLVGAAQRMPQFDLPYEHIFSECV